MINAIDILLYVLERPVLLLAIILWTLVWKGFSLWRAAELRQKWWFLALLVINTMGILEIIYLLTHRHRPSPAVITQQ